MLDKIRVLMLALATISTLLFTSCTTKQADITTATAAQIVDQVAMRGDQVDAVLVGACDEAERQAAELPDIESAERLVFEIRKRCDQAFEAVDKLAEAIVATDALMGRYESGEVKLTKVMEAALKARAAFARAVELHDTLKKYLEALKGDQ